MGRPKKWPSYALESLENTLALLKDFDRELKRAQELMADGEHERAQIAMSDARASALKCVEHLVRARAGKYERGDAGAWPAATEDVLSQSAPTRIRTKSPTRRPLP